MMVNSELLRIAILQQAIKDYQSALIHKRHRDCAALVRWFRSEWGQLLSGDKGDLIIAECKRRVETMDRPNRLVNKVVGKRERR